jgi:hypothetical protein
VAQVGVAGSSKLGNYVVLAGQVGIAGHLNIGNRVTLAAQSGVMHNIPDGETWFGYPAQPNKDVKRQMVALRRLPELLKTGQRNRRETWSRRKGSKDQRWRACEVIAQFSRGRFQVSVIYSLVCEQETLDFIKSLRLTDAI